MAEYKNQHFVPQVYLRQFIDLSEIPEDSDNDSLWIYDKIDKIVKIDCIKNICSDAFLYSFIDENGEYNHQLENWLSGFENHFKKILNRSQSIKRSIVNKRKIDWYQRCEINYLVTFVLIQYFRVPKFLNDFIEINKEGFKEIDSLEGIDQNEIGIVNDIKKYGFSQIFDIKNEKFQFLHRLIVSKNLYITVIPDNVDRDFCISDCPVLFTNSVNSNNALIHSYTEITIPITKKIAISFYEFGTKRFGRILSDINEIDRLNVSFLKISQKYCLSGKKACVEYLKEKDF